MSLQENFARIQGEIRDACEGCGRSIEDITLIAVTKTLNVKETEYVVQEGIVQLGENRPLPFLEKVEQIKDKATWHYIGSLQTRKVKEVISYIDYLHSLDRISLAKEIQKRASNVVHCFVQVKTSTEEAKQGVSLEEVETFIEELEQYDKIRVIGLMTMAPYTEDTAVISQCFNKLKEVQMQIQQKQLPYAPCTELSMGMSNDFELAIQQGATYIRIGTSLVGDLKMEDE